MAFDFDTKDLVKKAATFLSPDFALIQPDEDGKIPYEIADMAEARQLTALALLDNDITALYDLCKAVNMEILKGYSITSIAKKYGLSPGAVQSIKKFVQAELAHRLDNLTKKDVVFDLYQYLILYREEALKIASNPRVSGASKVMAVNAGVNASKALLELVTAAGLFDKEDGKEDPRIAFMHTLNVLSGEDDEDVE
jgi:hypothetical protein